MTHLVVGINDRASDGQTRFACQRVDALLIGESVPGSFAAVGLFLREGGPRGDCGFWQDGNGSGEEVEVGQAVSCMEPPDVHWWRGV